MARKTQQVEVRLVSEFLLKEYPKFETIRAQPLGRVNDSLLASVGYEKGIKMMRPFRPEVDAVVVLPRHLVIIEAKIWNVINGLAKLPLYKSLVPFTPELQRYMPREIIMELVVGWTNDNLAIMARDLDVRVKVFCPAWIEEVVQKMHQYWTRDYQEARQKKLEMREYFGVE